MHIIRNIMDLPKFLICLKYLNEYKDNIKKARASGDIEAERKNINLATSKWGKGLCETIKLDYKVEGYENLPEEGPVVFMPNHQGYADVVLMCAVLDKFQFGFVAKDKLDKVPVYGQWITLVRSVMINRGNPREGLKAIAEGVRYLKQGYSMLIFPEGTRSQSSEIGEFKAGAIKLATKAKVPIIPISVDGTWHCLEEKGYVTPAHAIVKIHPPIETANLTREEEKDLHNKVFKIVKDGLEEIKQKNQY